MVREKGTDAWWLSDTADLLPESLRDQPDQYRRGDDTMVRAAGQRLSKLWLVGWQLTTGTLSRSNWCRYRGWVKFGVARANWGSQCLCSDSSG